MNLLTGQLDAKASSHSLLHRERPEQIEGGRS